jgi:hypothetical protein
VVERCRSGEFGVWGWYHTVIIISISSSIRVIGLRGTSGGVEEGVEYT